MKTENKKNSMFGFLLFYSVHAEYMIFRICAMLNMLYSVDSIRNCYVVGVIIVML